MSRVVNTGFRAALGRLSGQALRRALKTIDTAAAEQGRPFREPELIRPNTDRRFFNVSH